MCFLDDRERVDPRRRPLLQAAVRVCGMAGAIPESALEHALLSALGTNGAEHRDAVRRVAATMARQRSRNATEAGALELLGKADAGRLSDLWRSLPREGAGTPAFEHLQNRTPWDWRTSEPARIAWSGAEGGSSTLVWAGMASRIEFDGDGAWEDRLVPTSPAASARAREAWKAAGVPARARAEAAWSALSEVSAPGRTPHAGLRRGPGGEFEALVMDGLRASAPAGRPPLLLGRCAALLAAALRIAEWKVEAGQGECLRYGDIADACGLDAMHAAAHDPRAPERVRQDAGTFLHRIPGYRLDTVPSRQHHLTLALHRPILDGVRRVLGALRALQGPIPSLGNAAPDWANLGLVPGAWDDSAGTPADAPPAAVPDRTAPGEDRPRLSVLCGRDGTPEAARDLLWEAAAVASRSAGESLGIYAVCGPEALGVFRSAPPGTAGMNIAVPAAGTNAAVGHIGSAKKGGAACIVLQGPLAGMPLGRVVMSAANGNPLVLAVPETAAEAEAAFLAACGDPFMRRVWDDLAGAAGFSDAETAAPGSPGG